MEWISVNDKIPQLEEPVLVCDENDKASVSICRLDSFTTLKVGVNYNWIEGRSGFDNWYKEVTHWMPLPLTPNIK